MLSKEEIEKENLEWKKLCNECSKVAKSVGFTKEDTDRIIKETREIQWKAKKYDELIEKLEKRRKQNNNKYGRAIDNDDFPEMYEYSGQMEEDDYLLSIVKGVENEILYKK